MRIKGYFSGPSYLTRNEFRLGRLLRDGEGHAGAAPVPAAAPTPAEPVTPQPTSEAADDFAAFEAELEKGEKADSGSGEPEKQEGNDVDGKPPVVDDKGAPPADELTAAQAAQQKAESERDTARAELEQLRAKQKPAEEKPAAGAEVEDKAPNPDDYQFGNADADYIAEHARWNARQEFKALRAKEDFDREISAVQTKWDAAIVPDLVAEMPDFQDKVVAGASRGDWACTPLMALGIKESDHGPQVAYHLATNPKEAERISKMHPLEQAREFGRLEGRFMSEKAGKAAGEKAPIAKIASTAPTPPAARSRGAGGQFSTAPDTDDFDAFDKMADGLIKSRR